MTTRNELIRREVTAIRIELRLVQLRRLAAATADAYDRANSALRNALADMIDDEKPYR
jgi:hypothetical protein